MNETVSLPRVGATTALAAIAALSGCTAQPSVTTNVIDQSLVQAMTTDSRYMMSTLASKTDAHGKTGIDLADHRQYQFVMNRLTAAGKTTANSPELFQRLHRSRDKAVALRSSGKTSSALLTATDWCDSRIQLGSEDRVGSTITYDGTHPDVSCLGGADYVYADIATYDANTAGTEAFLVSTSAGEDYSGGTAFNEVTIDPALPAELGRVNQTDSLIIAYDEFGTEQIAYTVVASNVVPIPGSLALAHPTIHSWIANGGFIQMCQLRGLPTQCDYGVGSLTGGVFNGWLANASGVFTGIAAVKTGTGTGTIPWEGDVNNYFAFSAGYVPGDLSHVYLPTQGVVDAGATVTGNCIIKTVDLADFRLVKTVNGGMCTTTTSFRTSFTIPPNSRTATFRTISDFVNNGGVGAGDCSLGRIINEDVKPSLTVRMMADCGSGTLVPRFASLSPEGGDALPYRIFFLNSCFAEGTPIRLASGKTTTVESLELGDKVVSDTKGTILTVTGTSHGVEAEPLVELRDNKGHQLRLTSKHPVVKASGDVVFASAIKKDDRVITDSGIASIVSTERVEYGGQVYNLKLGTAEEQAKVGKDGTTMFAGGFLVGDSAMQQNNDKPNRTVAQLPTAWSRDYLNAAVNNPPMKRVLR
jgi:hypothetical protein